MERVRLTNERIRNFKLNNKSSQLFLWDSEVPRLAVRATGGTKSFIFETKLNRNTIRITIGDTKIWSLEDARIEARRLAQLVDQKIDPREHAKELQRAKEKENSNRLALEIENERNKKFTLRALCMAYVEHLRNKGKIKSSRDCLSAFKVHVFKTPTADFPANEIKADQIANIVRQVYESGKHRTAGIVRNYLVSAYNSAKKAPYDPTILSNLIDFRITSNPAELVPSIAVNKGDRTLTDNELRGYMSSLTENNVDQLLWVHLLTGGQRMAQLCRVKVKDFDSSTGTLRLLDGKGRRNTLREHLLPLAPISKGIINELIVGAESGERLIFKVNARTAGDRVTEIRKTLNCPSFSIKDIRRTCETTLASMEISKETRAHLLSHGLGGIQDLHYDRYSYSKEKSSALIAWEKKLLQIKNNNKNLTYITDIKKIRKV